MQIIAEIGASHNGSIQRALDTVKAAAESGATGIKLQTWTPDTMDCGDRVIQSGPWKGISLRDLYREAWTPWKWHKPIIEKAKELGLTWHSTPFDIKALEFLESLECPRYKVASFEITDIPLIKAISETKKPIIISTGMATGDEIMRAVDAASGVPITLLHCVSAYPATIEDMNLMTMCRMGGFMNPFSVGLSDHTQTPVAAMLATALGATMIERHITLDRQDGLDDAFASTPDQFADMVMGIKLAQQCKGTGEYGAKPSEAPSLALRRSLWITQDLKQGDILTVDNLKTARPAEGLEPYRINELLGKPVKRDIKAGTPATRRMV